MLELRVLDETGTRLADIVFATIQDRRSRTILSIRDQNTYDSDLRRKRLMTLIQIYLIHRYRVFSVHYVSPTEDNLPQTSGMKELGIYDDVNTEVGHIIVAAVNFERMKALLNPDREELTRLIRKR